MVRIAWIAAGVAGLALAAGAAWAYVAFTVETPSYEVEAKAGDFELRRYPALVLASIETRGARGEAVRAGFGPLAGYIFAREREGDKIAMTAPVTQRAPGEAGGWTVSFIMPSDKTLADLPAPAGDVRLSELPPRRMAAVRFSGRWTDENFAEAAGRLARALDERGLTAAGPLEYAYYNDPFTPAFLRRNEVMVEVAGG